MVEPHIVSISLSPAVSQNTTRLAARPGENGNIAPVLSYHMSRGALDWLNEHFPRDFFDEGIARRALRIRLCCIKYGIEDPDTLAGRIQKDGAG